MKKGILYLSVISLLLCLTFTASATTYKVAIMKLPQADSYKNLFAAIGEATGNTFEIEIVPPARASNMIENKLVDVQVPRIQGKSEAYNKTLKFDFANAKVGHKAPFVLYTNKNKPIDINELKNGNPKGYKIETDGSNVKQFGFTASFSSGIKQSLQKLAAGRIDGYLNAQISTDRMLKSLKLNNIRRQLYDSFDSAFTLQKGQEGGKLDKILEEGIKKLRANGKLQEIMKGSFNSSKYDEWQP